MLAIIFLASLLSAASLGQSKDPKFATQLDENSYQLTNILEQVGERVQQYFGGMLSIVCTEVARQQELQPDLLTPKGKPRELVYDFMIVRQPSPTNQPEPHIRELRTLKLINGKPAKKRDRAPYPDPWSAYTTSLLFLLPNHRGANY